MIPISKPIIGEEEKKAVLDVLNSGMLAQGRKVRELEDLFASLCSTKYAVALSNGTTALHTCLASLGIKSGDEVITTPFTFVASANSILMQGAKPIFVDICEDTFTIDPEKIEEKITSRTKAILTVDLYGQLCDYREINKIAREYNLRIVEDACQAVNASLDDKKAGSFGDVAAFSLYATKNIMCGEGGVITTNYYELAEFAKRFRHHGQSEQTGYEYFSLGYNYRMTDIQAAIAVEQLKKVEDFTKKRIENARLLTDGLKNIKGVSVPFVRPNYKHVFHQYTIKVDGFRLTRDNLLNYLKENEIGCSIFYPKPLHLFDHYRKLGYEEGDFPVAERVSKQVLSLPVHPSLKKEEIQKIINVFKGLK